MKIHRLTLAALAALGLAFAGGALAQKAEPAKDAKKTEAPAKKADATPKAKADATPKADAKKAGALIDINTASEKELASLKGIGDVRAKAIVKGRPYKGKDDLVNRKIIPQGVYDDVKDQIIAKQDMAAAAKKEEKKK
jgi:DNA uptake protein ComE-like DNA-binding protein